MKEGVVFVPGIMGSVLEDAEGIVWPGTLGDILRPYRKMARLKNPNLRATDVIRRVSVLSQYEDLMQALANIGFNERPLGGDPPTLKALPYDWRKDNAIAAASLADAVDAMAAQLGNDCEINVLAHSMGGLVSRCYLESGLYDGRPGFARVRRLITLATPHLGAPLALTAARGDEKRAFLSAAQVQEIANDPQFPALYQLLPPRGEPFVWDRNDGGRFEPIDVYDQANVGRLGLVQANIDSAVAFRSMLDVTRRPARVRYFLFAGTRQETTSSVQLRISEAGVVTDVKKIDRRDAGDGTVPIWSGMLSGLQMEPVGGEHGEIYKNHGLKSVLGALLGKPGLMLAVGPVPELSVLPKVATPGEAVRVTVDVPASTDSINGRLQISKQVDAAGNTIAGAAVIASLPVSYGGPPLDHLALLIVAPDFPGIYELIFTNAQGQVAFTQLVVQEQ